MAKLVFAKSTRAVTWLFIFAFSSAAIAAKLEYLSQVSFDSAYKFEKTRFGGISGMVWDENEKVLWLLTDDRGKVNPPRIYKATLDLTLLKRKPPIPKFDLKVQAVYEVQEKGKTLPVFDFEGIALLPWGNLLLSSEGDDGSRPRRPQRLIDVKIIDAKSEETAAAKAAGRPSEKPHALYIRDFDLPKWFISENSGKPTQGLRTNLGFEGLALSLDHKSVVAGAESHLTQDTPSKARLIQFDIGAFTMTPSKEWIYPLDTDGPAGPWLLRGISEILPVENDRWWIMERGLQLGAPPLTTQIFEVELKDGFNINPIPAKAPKSGDLPELKKTLVVDLDKFGPTPLADNFEAMAWGPRIDDGRRLLILANDNNFQSGSATYFVFVAVTLDKSASKREPSAESQKATTWSKTDGSTNALETQKR